MAKTASWRDASKKTKSGIIPQYRLQLPYGEAVLALPRDYPFSQNNMGDECFEIRCIALNLRGITTNERDEKKAKKAALEILQKYINELIQNGTDNLEAIKNIQVKERELARADKAVAADIPATKKTRVTAKSAPESNASKKTRRNTTGASAAVNTNTKTQSKANTKKSTSKPESKTTKNTTLPNTPKKRGRRKKSEA